MAKEKGKVVIRQFLDDQENAIISTEKDKTIALDLKLVSEKRRRRIGVLTKSTGTFNVVRIRAKHLHNKLNAYGFNHKILEMSKRIKNVVLTDDITRYKIPKEFIMNNTNFLFFKQQGFELQTFLTLDLVVSHRFFRR